MSELSSDLVAFIVGIERYDQPGWDVPGPCRNAIRMAEYLLGAFEQRAEIQLFANIATTDSSLEAQSKQDALDQLKARGVAVHDHNFTRDTIDTAFRKLRERRGRLLLHWSGHGYADNAGHRILVCPDFRSDGFANRVFNATLRFEWLHSSEFSDLAQQILLMDVCAKSTKLQFEADAVGNGRRHLDTEQIGFFATQEGAYNYIDGQTFTDLLIAALRPFGGWPDLRRYYESAKQRAFALNTEPFIISGFARHDRLNETYAGNRDAGKASKARSALPIIANYADVCSTLDDFVAPTGEQRILLVQGDAGFGKSLLVLERARAFPDNVRYIGAKLTKRYNITELLSRTVAKLGVQHLPRFVAGVRALGGPLQIQVSTELPFGWQDTINRASIGDSVDHIVPLVECLFEDCLALSEPLLFILDGFEASSTQLRELIEDHFLRCVAQTPTVRVIVSGRDIPDRNHIEWGNSCAPICKLAGVPNPSDWIPVVTALGRRISARDPESYLGGICHLLEGQPNKIMAWIQGLPEENG
ncbi:ATP-binding protein [Bradyrhizobium sp. LTSP857]|uniref:ATP-binding protein n=1 Tax=Bradyrhizobium sp. LTSP857 TaxID=1619231 RepID=UPI0005D17454|nr:ATP-binding protein [Bradyrhizobium sp. LTSP857]KJC33347.1 hypothetical protein UP06_38420 [Bradyrhizobium sp. LTSP857]